MHPMGGRQEIWELLKEIKDQSKEQWQIGESWGVCRDSHPNGLSNHAL